MSMVGGFGNARDADSDDQVVLESVKHEIESRLGRPVGKLSAVKVTTQVVAGVNYLIKAVADDTIVHAKICKPLPHTGQPPFLLAFQHGLTLESPLVPFE